MAEQKNNIKTKYLKGIDPGQGDPDAKPNEEFIKSHPFWKDLEKKEKAMEKNETKRI